jgi:hypothetical protein
MKLKHVIAGAAIGCTLGVTGISLGSGVANAAPCMPSPQAQCGPGGPGGPPPQRGPGGPGGTPPTGPPPGDFRGPGGPPPGDFRGPGGPGGPDGPPPGDFRRGPDGPGGPPGDFRGPGGPDFRGPGGPDFRGPGGPDFRGPDNHDWRPPWNPGDNDWRGRFQGAPWGNQLPPWGWGAPPPPPWDGPLPGAWGPPPPPINYWGFNEQPLWDQGQNQWGFWFFGIWIPLPI